MRISFSAQSLLRSGNLVLFIGLMPQAHIEMASLISPSDKEKSPRSPVGFVVKKAKNDKKCSDSRALGLCDESDGGVKDIINKFFLGSTNIVWN